MHWLFRVVTTYPDGAQDFVILYSTPKKPGITRWVGNQFMIRPKNSKAKKSGFIRDGIKLPTWMNHTLISLFIHQDVAFLHYQERYIARFKKSASLHERYWMPNPQDKDVIVFRKWFERAGGYIPYAGYEKGYVPPLLSEEEMFDFYEAHAKYCRHCQRGLAIVRTARVMAWAATGFCFMRAMVVAALRPSASWLPPQGSLIAGAIGLICAGIAFMIQKFMTLFFVYKYNHQDNN